MPRTLNALCHSTVLAILQGPPRKRTADQCYQLLKADPSHPSLHFKKIGKNYWSVRTGLSYRALGVEVENGISWFWIGTHADYDQLINRL